MLELSKIAGFEIAKLCCSEDLRFRARNRRNRLFGEWAASRLGLSASEAETYARRLVAIGVEHSGDAEILDRVLQDFTARDIPLSDWVARRELDRLEAVASQEAHAANAAPRLLAA